MKTFLYALLLMLFICSSAFSDGLFSTKDKLLTTTLAPTVSTLAAFDKTTFSTDSNNKKSKPKNLKAFVMNNIDNLTYDIARGEGETITSLAEIGGIPEKGKECFFKTLKENFDLIFPTCNTDRKHSFIMIRGYLKGYKKRCF